ncbi:MAG: hypothetical protein HRT74_01950 [Flavobacteriales bacterium]|nr:hypothetical protein [Flavobacteriales bacterium]
MKCKLKAYCSFDQQKVGNGYEQGISGSLQTNMEKLKAITFNTDRF